MEIPDESYFGGWLVSGIYFTNNRLLLRTGACLSIPGRGDGWLGSPFRKEKRSNAERVVKLLSHLGNASRDDIQGERSSAAVSISSAGAAKKGAG